MLVLGTSIGVARITDAQTPTTPPAEGQPPAETQPAQAPAPQPVPQQIPLQQYPIQQPGRPLITPATPPSTTIPPWTPPVPPPPSQTNVPSPFPFATPGIPGAPGTPGAIGGIPNLTVPGAFGPTVATVRGATLEFHPTARTALEYSDNFFQTTSHTEQNFRSILGPGFTLFLNGARTFGTLSTTLDLVHDTASNSGPEVKVFPSVNATILYALTPRLALTLSDTYVRSDSPNAADQFGVRRGRQTFDTNTLSLTADWLLDQVATQAYYRNVLFFNESPTGNPPNGQPGQTNNSNQQDTVTNIVGVNASTRFLTDYIGRLGYEFSASNNINGGGSGDDGTSHTVFASVARQFGLYTTGGISSSFQYQTNDSTKIYNASLFGSYGLPTGLSVSAAVGYSILQSDTEDSEGTVSANVTVSYRFSRAAISVGAFSDFRQTAQTGQNFGTVETRSVFGSFLYQLTPFINTVVSATYSENSPTGTGNSTNTSQTQKNLTYGASLNWQILRWLSASVAYTYTKQTGNDAFDQTFFGNGDFAENRAILSLFATF
jgi:hypothetical protein